MSINRGSLRRKQRKVPTWVRYRICCSYLSRLGPSHTPIHTSRQRNGSVRTILQQSGQKSLPHDHNGERFAFGQRNLHLLQFYVTVSLV